MGLNDSFVVIRGQILLMQPLPNTCWVYLLSFNKKSRLKFLHHAMPADQDSKATPTHQVQRQKTLLHCSSCDRDYHIIEKCYYLHSFPIGHKLHGKNVRPPNQHHSNANNVKVETNKVAETKTKFLPINDGPRLTTEEYNQLMAMV